MKTFSQNIIAALLAVLLASLPSLAIGHSALFPDQFSYDQSGEGLVSSVSANVRAKDGSHQSQKSGAQLVEASCTNGLASDYPCRNIDMRSMLSPAQLGGSGSNLNDVWGWTDLINGSEIVIVGRDNGTSFVDITDPVDPQLLGFLPSHDGGSDDWRDIKVYQNHAFIVADGSGNSTHGLQIFDLSTLSTATGGTLTETAHLGGFGAAHNIAINEDSGFAYVVGASQCSGGLYMVDISSPTTPTFAGCYSADGYTHDAQCVMYQGPDTQHFNKEICVGYNEDTITIVDVSNKSNPQQLSRTTYQGQQYTHQGWFLDENHSYLVMNDELDEQNNGSNTTSYLWDVSVLGAPVETGRFVNTTEAIDHNLYTLDSLIYESNYRSGLRILSSADIASGNLEELAYCDTIPCSDTAQFSGAWSSYIYFASGNIAVSDIGTGLFIVRPDANAISTGANAGTTATSPACGTTPAPAPDPTPEPIPDSAPASGGGGATLPMFVGMLGLGVLWFRRRSLVPAATSSTHSDIG